MLRDKEMVERGCFGEYYPAKILHSICSNCQHKKDPHPPPAALLLDESQVEKYKIGCVFYFYAKVVQGVFLTGTHPKSSKYKKLI